MSAVNQSRLKLTLICSAVCGGGLLLLLVGLPRTSRDKEAVARNSGKGAVQTEPGHHGTPGGQSAMALPVADRFAPLRAEHEAVASHTQQNRSTPADGRTFGLPRMRTSSLTGASAARPIMCSCFQGPCTNLRVLLHLMRDHEGR
jgi:hypothetical protein